MEGDSLFIGTANVLTPVQNFMNKPIKNSFVSVFDKIYVIYSQKASELRSHHLKPLEA